jgi:S-DNA-T family DNA segregation ATPase FtsK/SpoIIIE
MFFLLRMVPIRALLLIVVVAFVTYVVTNQPSWLLDPARDAGETALERAGVGVITMGLWFLAFFALLIKKPILLVKKWRLLIGTSLLTTAIQGGLSYFEAELPLIGVADLGGTLGQEAQGPSELLAYVRIGTVAAFGVWFVMPSISNKLMRGTGKGAGATAVGAVHAYRFAPLHRGLGKVVGLTARGGFSIAKGGVKGGMKGSAALAKGGAVVAKSGGGVVAGASGAAVGAARDARAGRRDGKLSRELEGFFSSSGDAPANRVLPPANDDLPPFLQDADARPRASATASAPYVVDEPAPQVVTPAEIITPPPEPKREPRKPRVVEPQGTPEPEIRRPSAAEWQLPDISSLSMGAPSGAVTEEHHATAGVIEETLAQHGVEVSVSEIKPGPSVTMFGLVPGWNRRARPGARGRAQDPDQPAQDMFTEARSRVKVDSILAREKDLALSLAAPSLRLQAPVPGEAIVGVEVPNKSSTTVMIRRIMESDEYHEVLDAGGLPVALGLASAGEPVVIDLLKMPHLLIAGATGSGKSVCMNSIISSIIAHQPPTRVRMMLVDPKRVELTPYNGVPHLVTPVVTEPDRVVRLLRGAIQEMSRRYKLLEGAGVRNIVSYNRSPKATEDMPYFVICIDELADLMMTASFEVEQGICRLAQLGRATGIHLVVATQRPSVDVVTGLIKANFPSRIAFAVASQVDSRTIIDTAGAERLLGRGDMLYLSPDSAKARRVQGVLITEEETDVLADHWRSHPPRALPEVSLEDMAREAEMAAAIKEEATFEETDSLYDKALAVAAANRQLSTSLLQRKLRIGYPRAARLMDQLEDEGIVGASGEAGKARDVIYLPDDD